jgi:hypothetical protein
MILFDEEDGLDDTPMFKQRVRLGSPDQLGQWLFLALQHHMLRARRYESPGE